MGGACSAHDGDEKCVYFFVGKREKKRSHGRCMHRRENYIKIDIKMGERVRIGFIWLRIGTVAGYCEHGNEPSDSKRGRDVFD
jgi:hypothetical protein